VRFDCDILISTAGDVPAGARNQTEPQEITIMMDQPSDTKTAAHNASRVAYESAIAQGMTKAEAKLLAGDAYDAVFAAA
jgi:hypothetical protein